MFSDDSERDPISLNALVGRVTDESQPIVLNGLKFKDLNHALLGRVVGDVVESSISLPKVIQASGFSQETHRAIITIHKVEISNPLSVDEVIQMYGSPNILVLKSQIKASLERRFELDKMAFMTDDLFRQLLERIDYSPPERIVKSREFEIGQNADVWFVKCDEHLNLHNVTYKGDCKYSKNIRELQVKHTNSYQSFK